MKLIKSLGVLVFAALGFFGLSSDCTDFRSEVPKKVEKKVMGNLPLEEIYLSAKADINGDGLIDRVVLGKVKGRDKCRAYVLENDEGTNYRPKILMDNIPRYPVRNFGWIDSMGKNGGLDIGISIDNHPYNKKQNLELKLGNKTYSTKLDKKKD